MSVMVEEFGLFCSSIGAIVLNKKVLLKQYHFVIIGNNKITIVSEKSKRGANVNYYLFKRT